MSTGHTWQQPFVGQPEQARHVRAWVALHIAEHAADEHVTPDPESVADIALLASELFSAVLATRAGKIHMKLSTSGDRVRIYATSPVPLPMRARAGLGIVQGLALARGAQDDDRTIWAEAQIGGAS